MSDAVALTIVSTIPSIILSIASLIKSVRTGRDVQTLNDRMDAAHGIDGAVNDATRHQEHLAVSYLAAAIRATPDDMPTPPKNGNA